MRKLLFLLFILFALKTNAQNYQISFAGNGESNTVGTVIVENLSSEAILTLNGEDILQLSITTKVNPIIKTESSFIKIYPNPVTGTSKLSVFPSVAGNATIEILDLNGNKIFKYTTYFKTELYEFLISDLNSGVYLVDILGTNFRFAEKLISLVKSSGKVNLKMISESEVDYQKKFETVTNKGSHSIVDMEYKTGDRLKFTGTSGNYSTVKTDVPTKDETITFNFMPCTDGDNNNYPVVEIGEQIWMASNLKSTKYRNGENIGTTNPAGLDLTAESEPKYQWDYEGNLSYGNVYGKLYTWYAATDVRGICPVDWYVPAEEDMIELSTYLGGESVAGGKLKETGTTHWTVPNLGATNETGFTALPGGIRPLDGVFHGMGDNGLWLYTETKTSNAWLNFLWYSIIKSYLGDGPRGWAYSVRCLKKQLPKILSTSISNVTLSTATAGGLITNNCGSPITSSGVCWSTTHNPSVSDNNVENLSGEASFICNIAGLLPNSTYYLRAFAINNIGISYGKELTLRTFSGTVSDIDGNTYFVVTLGNQQWMAENLKTTRYANGDLIGTTTPATLDITNENTPEYQWAYAGNEDNVSTYGRLYTWNVVVDNRKICPINWHIPTFDEWDILKGFLILNGYNYNGTLDDNDIAKSMASTSGWYSQNAIEGTIGYDQASNNSCSFSSQPGGFRETGFNNLGKEAHFWTATNRLESAAWDHGMVYHSGSLGFGVFYRYNGLSVRCVHD